MDTTRASSEGDHVVVPGEEETVVELGPDDLFDEPQDLLAVARVLRNLPEIDSVDHLIDCSRPPGGKRCPSPRKP
jgi:hypothetical protein